MQEADPTGRASDAAVGPLTRPIGPPTLRGSLASNKSVELAPVDDPHRTAFAGYFRGKRQDAVDACRDDFKMPRMQELLPQSVVIAARGAPFASVQEASMRQIVSVDVVVTRDGSGIEGAHVLETSLEFPAPDGTLRRVLLADDSLDRCVERALVEGSDTAPPGPIVERFTMVGIAGEAVFDLR